MSPSRLSLLVASAAFALSGCMQSAGPVAKVDQQKPRSSLDALAYGDLQPTAGKPAQQEGFFSGRAVASNTPTPASPKQDVETTASIAPSPRVIMADSAPAKNDARSSSGGLFAALGIRTEPVSEPSPMQANAQMPPPATPAAYPAPAMLNRDPDYKIDAGDKLRVVVFGQEGLTNTYAIDAGGGITMPLIGRVMARGLTPVGLAAHITARLRKGYIREPSVAVEIEAYRPFFILGEVAAPGQYPYVPNMSVEAAVAIAGGFSPRARRDVAVLTHKVDGAQVRAEVPLGTPLSPGDTIMVRERWF